MNRNNQITKIKERYKPWDVVVIGGGASGLGVALDAVSRGLEVLVLEKYDFGKGTSSKSTKLVHGGVRYLQQGNVALVKEALRERGYFLEQAKENAHIQPFIVPFYRWWEGIYYYTGLKMYDWLSGKWSLGGSQWLKKSTVQSKLSNIEENGLKGGILYTDGQFDDARLCIDLVRTIVKNGGTAINYLGVSQLLKQDGKIVGVSAHNEETGEKFEIRSKYVVNATGVLTDEIVQMDTPGERKTIVPSRGSHVVLDGAFLKGNEGMMIPKTNDGRVLFVIPWLGKVIVGTTDQKTEKPILEPKATEEEIDFILQNAANYLTRKPKRSDVLATFAGLRPLAAPKEGSQKTKEISRGHKVIISKSGLATVIGGKWTTFRKMGEDVLNKIDRKLSAKFSPSTSSNLHLQITPVHSSDSLIHSQLPYSWKDIDNVIAHEMAVKLEDVLCRRTRCMFLHVGATMEIAEEVANKMASAMGKDASWVAKQVSEFKELAKQYGA